MIPYKDDNPTTTFPLFTIGIIALNVVVFVWELISPSGAESIVFKYGAMPASLVGSEEAPLRPVHPAITLFTSMFLHGGFFHIGGNMLYLWIFGNNIEDRLGHLRFLLFYLLCGVIAAYSHALTSPSSNIPMIGASGAISGILGAYLVLYPHARVHTLIFFGFFYQVVKVPALIVIGFWAIIQLINGLISTGVLKQGGVAWFAHIGGFVAGVLLIKLFDPRKRRPEKWL